MVSRWLDSGHQCRYCDSIGRAVAGVLLLPASGKGELRVFRRNAWTPSWSPDGTRLAFTVEHPRGHWRVYTAKVDGTDETALGDANVDNGSPAWSPDGDRIAFDQFTDASGRQQVFVMNADGSAKHPITIDPAWSCMRPSWSPDGKRLAVCIALRHGIVLDGPQDVGVYSWSVCSGGRDWLVPDADFRSRWSHGVFLAGVKMILMWRSRLATIELKVCSDDDSGAISEVYRR